MEGPISQRQKSSIFFFNRSSPRDSTCEEFLFRTNHFFISCVVLFFGLATLSPVYGEVQPPQELSIIASDKGYFPKQLATTENIPVRLHITGASKRALCFVIDEFKIQKKIRPDSVESVEFIPTTPGKYSYHCPINGMKGALIVKENRPKLQENPPTTNESELDSDSGRLLASIDSSAGAVTLKSDVENRSEDLKLGGFLDMYFAVNGNNPSIPAAQPGILPVPQNRFHANDMYHNSFGLNQVELNLQKTTQTIQFRMDLDFGEFTDWASASAIIPANSMAEEVLKHIGQANVSWTPKSMPQLTLTAGKVYSFLGYEPVKSKDNFNYSRSLLFQLGIPFWHIGLNAAYALIPKRLSVSAHVYNGWNNIISNTPGKHFGAQISYNPTDELSLNLGALSGPANPFDTSNRANIFNLYGQWNISPSFQWAFDSIYVTWGQHPSAVGGTADVTWAGFETLVKWQVTPQWSWSPRIELFHDPNGAAMASFPSLNAFAQAETVLYSATLTTAFLLAEGLEAKLEMRLDGANHPVFDSSNGLTPQQLTGLAGIVYSF